MHNRTKDQSSTTSNCFAFCESVASYLHPDVSAFTHIPDRQWICRVIEPPVVIPNRKKKLWEKTAGKTKGCLLSGHWHCGLTCRWYWSVCEFLVCVLRWFHPAQDVPPLQVAVCRKVAGAHQGFAPSVSVWTCERAPGQLLHSCLALTSQKNKKTKHC